MEVKNYIKIHNKESFFKKRYPFADPPSLDEKKFCIHCNEIITVGDYKVELLDDKKYIVCPNAPECDGSVIDWFNLTEEEIKEMTK